MAALKRKIPTEHFDERVMKATKVKDLLEIAQEFNT
jgi:hypothetical protein